MLNEKQQMHAHEPGKQKPTVMNKPILTAVTGTPIARGTVLIAADREDPVADLGLEQNKMLQSR